ncbi:tryptophan synthase subunit alpha [Bacillus sp. FSL K6-3431]|uniref:tryptophan synthase subunit alpha n=1 Tax=Bacillus sp. FSL K6-3431 TaxID=2921500 RepID=UPI0030FA39E1
MIAEHQKIIHQVKSKKVPFLTGYFVGGDPTPNETVQYIKEAVKSGIDAVEIGIPSPNPFMEGDVIKRCHARTYPHFREVEQIRAFLKTLRNEVPAPIWIMGYYTDIIASGLYNKLVGDNLIDGLIIPDLPLQEMFQLRQKLQKQNVSVIPVINNTMSNGDLKLAIAEADIIYCQLYQGKTGSATPDFSGLPLFYNKIRTLTDAVLMGGFGVKNLQLAKEVIESGFEGVVVGSEIVRIIEDQNMQHLSEFIKELAKVKILHEEE